MGRSEIKMRPNLFGSLVVLLLISSGEGSISNNKEGTEGKLTFESGNVVTATVKNDTSAEKNIFSWANMFVPPAPTTSAPMVVVIQTDGWGQTVTSSNSGNTVVQYPPTPDQGWAPSSTAGQGWGQPAVTTPPTPAQPEYGWYSPPVYTTTVGWGPPPAPTTTPPPQNQGWGYADHGWYSPPITTSTTVKPQDFGWGPPPSTTTTTVKPPSGWNQPANGWGPPPTPAVTTPPPTTTPKPQATGWGAPPSPEQTTRPPPPPASGWNQPANGWGPPPPTTSTTTTTPKPPQDSGWSWSAPTSSMGWNPSPTQPTSTTPRPIPSWLQCPAKQTEFPVYFPHEKSCFSFYQCSYGRPLLLQCRFGLHFNPFFSVCDWPELAGCPYETKEGSEISPN